MDWFWYFVGAGCGIFALLFVLWVYDKIGLLDVTIKIRKKEH